MIALSLVLMFGLSSRSETLVLPAGAGQAGIPRVAIWNPEKPASHARVQLFEALLDRAAESLSRSGAEVERLSAEEFVDKARFNVD